MRRRREERRERRGGGEDKTHYQMREKLVSIGDDYWIENNRGEKVFKVDGKALRVRQTHAVEIQDRQDDSLTLAVTACIDPMPHAHASPPRRPQPERVASSRCR